MRSDARRDRVLVAPEVDHPVVLLVTAALVAHRDAAALLRPVPFGSVVTSGQYGSPLCSPGVTTLTSARRPGEVGLTLTNGIAYSVAAKLISCPAARRTYAFFQLRRRP
jgi:hypothetical protein